MSFILDALRKSDAERQRAVTPGLSDVRYATRRARRSIWLPILVVVLVANMLVMAAQWFGGRKDVPAEAPAPAPMTPVAVAPLPIPATAIPEAEIRPLAREAEFGEPTLEPEMTDEFMAPAPVVVEAPEMAMTTGLSPPATPEAVPVPAGAPQPSAPSRIVAGNELPTAEQLIGSGALNIPLLNLDLHVYSDRPAGRFVVINSRKYKEGGQLTEGPRVDRITADGVILVSNGRQFTLSRK